MKPKLQGGRCCAYMGDRVVRVQLMQCTLVIPRLCDLIYALTERNTPCPLVLCMSFVLCQAHRTAKGRERAPIEVRANVGREL